VVDSAVVEVEDSTTADEVDSTTADEVVSTTAEEVEAMTLYEETTAEVSEVASVVEVVVSLVLVLVSRVVTGTYVDLVALAEVVFSVVSDEVVFTGFDAEVVVAWQSQFVSQNSIIHILPWMKLE
jgi:hypothetical protein